MLVILPPDVYSTLNSKSTTGGQVLYISRLGYSLWMKLVELNNWTASTQSLFVFVLLHDEQSAWQHYNPPTLDFILHMNDSSDSSIQYKELTGNLKRRKREKKRSRKREESKDRILTDMIIAPTDSNSFAEQQQPYCLNPRTASMSHNLPKTFLNSLSVNYFGWCMWPCSGEGCWLFHNIFSFHFVHHFGSITVGETHLKYSLYRYTNIYCLSLKINTIHLT